MKYKLIIHYSFQSGKPQRVIMTNDENMVYKVKQLAHVTYVEVYKANSTIGVNI